MYLHRGVWESLEPVRRRKRERPWSHATSFVRVGERGGVRLQRNSVAFPNVATEKLIIITLLSASTGVVNAIRPPTPSATSSATDICTATMDIIEDKEGFSDNDLACATNCIVASAELAGPEVHAKLSFKARWKSSGSRVAKEKEVRNNSRVVSHFWQGGHLRPWSPLVEIVMPDTPIAGTGTSENAFSHLAGATSDHFAAGQALILNTKCQPV
ncbi:hypothetical protein EDB84DRAFT_1653056 [Lactarius hengduanensis]|nr:hypothetical protein EDB84DRAFT_1653056 [Lactarius hengduanensis]